MSWEDEHGAAATAERGGTATGDSPAARADAYPIRQLVVYQRLIAGGEKVDPDQVVEEFTARNPDVDLDAHATFGEWGADLVRGSSDGQPGASPTPEE